MAGGTAAFPVFIHPRRMIGGREFDFDREIAVMAIINRTPDSFFDQGATFALDKAVAAAHQAISDGADWVDIGGVKFAPGPPVPVEQEIDRVVPVVLALRGAGAVISVDTFQPAVARAALAAGADVINDTTGIHDPLMADIVADSDATLVVTHSLARPRMPHPAPRYGDVVGEVAAFLRERTELALSRGIPAERIIIDPGHDLNKNTRHSLELTRRLPEIAALGYPTLVAVSNKDFIGETLGRARDERVEGSLAAAVFSIMQGARIVRMHNVRAAVDAVRMTEAILGFREPAYERHNLA
ncbi:MULTISPECIES: dihydropteroate synthase [unclassified Cryobacterium]|nr:MULTISPECIES: dihydropteroate synthase [unclassified Cryobacterium]MDY7528922.1 dihydropteroate synthase [Cryobacterium sp. 10C2]MEB0200731.1 dihydropteroate synthase [Cryobacterium sp. 5I3]MEB0286750.1 dihydropteroate synthase [Cryobacterium sp. 10S3]WPX12699.1 dihydropteroate synthase [Cryobacterium sp. 10S3]